MTIGEVKWTAFDLPTVDFHCQLFSYIQEKNKTMSNVNGTDDFIRSTKSYKNNVTKYETNFPRFYRMPSRKTSQYSTETLPTYLRNLIDHPETSRNLYRDEREFDEKLGESISLMIDIIKEKGWTN